MRSADLLVVAEYLLTAQSRKPKDVFLRRAMSTAYYAVFSSLCTCCADQLVGKSMRKLQPNLWTIAYRSIDHGKTANKFDRNNLKAISPSEEIRKFAREFVELRKLRVSADYDPTYVATKSDVATVIRRARTAIETLGACDKEELQRMAVYLALHDAKRPWPE